MARPSRTPTPLDADALRRLALRYVERYATTRAKLHGYLARKVRERGWTAEEPAAGRVERLVEDCAAQGFVDDDAWADARVRALSSRGWGAARIVPDLRQAGIGVEEWRDVLRDDARQWEAAERYARRKRLGPFAEAVGDPDKRRRQLAAMARAGHPYDIARRLVEAAPGDVPERDR